MVNASPPAVHKQCIRRRNGTDDYSIETARPYRSFFRQPFGAPISNLLTLNLERSAVSESPDPAQACKSNTGGNSVLSRIPAWPGTITLPALTHYQSGSHWNMPSWQASWPRPGYIQPRWWKALGRVPSRPHLCDGTSCSGLYHKRVAIVQAQTHLELKRTNHAPRVIRALLRQPTLNTHGFDLCGIALGLSLMDGAIKRSCCCFSSQTTTPVVPIPHRLCDPSHLLCMNELEEVLPFADSRLQRWRTLSARTHCKQKSIFITQYLRTYTPQEDIM